MLAIFQEIETLRENRSYFLCPESYAFCTTLSLMRTKADFRSIFRANSFLVIENEQRSKAVWIRSLQFADPHQKKTGFLYVAGALQKKHSLSPAVIGTATAMSSVSSSMTEPSKAPCWSSSRFRFICNRAVAAMPSEDAPFLNCWRLTVVSDCAAARWCSVSNRITAKTAVISGF